MIRDEYPLGFKLALHRKDLGIVLEMAGAEGAMLPLAMLVATLEDRLAAEGHGDEDLSVLARAIRELAAEPLAAEPLAAEPPAAGTNPPPSAPRNPAEPGRGPV
jgi:hypothetical protein